MGEVVARASIVHARLVGCDENTKAIMEIFLRFALRAKRMRLAMIWAGNYKLNLPKNVGEADVRANLQKEGLQSMAEYAQKSQDPSF